MTDQASDHSSSATSMTTIIDEIYEFSAPRFFDFTNGETDEDMHKAELWFESALSYAPSPCMVRIKTGRTITVETLCDFSDSEKLKKGSKLSAETNFQSESIPASKEVNCEKASPDVEGASFLAPVTAQGQRSSAAEIKKLVGSDDKENIRPTIKGEVQTPKVMGNSQKGDAVKNLTDKMIASVVRNPLALKPENSSQSSSDENIRPAATKGEVQTPKAMGNSRKGDAAKNLTEKKIASLVRNPSAWKPRNSSQSSSNSVKRIPNLKSTAANPNLAQENQAIKRQKLDGGKSRQILNVKPPTLTHKSKLGIASNYSSANHVPKEERKLYVRDPPAHFVAAAEMVKKFQSGTRDLSLPHLSSSMQGKPKLTLTRPKEPEFETSQRVRSVRVKSTAELEAEMMAQIPKFKARPLNKKILEAPTLASVQRTVPKPPEFQEFHLQTMARASQNAESASVTSTEASHQTNQWKPYYLTEPRTPVLQTSLRARPVTMKSSVELEQEELEKLPKFKARPLNKKILEGKGSLGVFCNTKKQQTKPQEFHFATDERFPQQTFVFDLFDKLSLNSDAQKENPLPRNTNSNPFHLYTEERGAEKERRFLMDLMQKQFEEEKVRVPKANPYPYTTDYPVVPPKPGPKQCTRPEPFQLVSVLRHEEELKREMEERRRKEEEEAKMRIFKAQPILKEDPIPLPEKVRRPLTEVHEFNHHVDHRAMNRAEFDHKVKEKEMMYKRHREESETERMMEEEKALKHMRRTMVPHARPVPKFNHPFYPQKSNKEPTKARSPNLRVIRRNEMRNKILGRAIPASMR